jgi:hypothetical protein
MKQPVNKTLGQFVYMVNQFGIDPSNDNQVEALARQFFGNSQRQIDNARDHLAKHTIGAANQTGLIYKDGPFTWMTGELFSDVTYGGNLLMQWMPFEPMEPTREETVSHLSWWLLLGGNRRLRRTVTFWLSWILVRKRTSVIRCVLPVTGQLLNIM